MMRTAPLQDRSQGQQPLSLHSSCPRVPVFGLKRGAFSQSALKRKPHPALERGLRKIGPLSGSDWSMRESLMLAGVGAKRDEQTELYNAALWRSYALFPLLCHICFYHCACRNGGYPLSPVFIFDRPGIRCDDLARYPWRMPRGVWSWCCAMQRERNETAEASRCYRCFPRCYCNGSRMVRPSFLCSRRFYPIRVCADLAVAWRFVRLVLCWVAAPLICNLGYGGFSFDAEGDED